MTKFEEQCSEIWENSFWQAMAESHPDPSQYAKDRVQAFCRRDQKRKVARMATPQFAMARSR